MRITRPLLGSVGWSAVAVATRTEVMSRTQLEPTNRTRPDEPLPAAVVAGVRRRKMEFGLLRQKLDPAVFIQSSGQSPGRLNDGPIILIERPPLPSEHEQPNERLD